MSDEVKHTALPILPLGPHQGVELIHLIAKRSDIFHDDGGNEGLDASPLFFCFGSISASCVHSRQFIRNIYPHSGNCAALRSVDS